MWSNLCSAPHDEVEYGNTELLTSSVHIAGHGLLLQAFCVAVIWQKFDLLVKPFIIEPQRFRVAASVWKLWDNMACCALSMQIMFTAFCGPFVAAMFWALGNFSFSSRSQNSGCLAVLEHVETLILYQVVSKQCEILFLHCLLSLHWILSLTFLWSGRNTTRQITFYCAWVWCVGVIAGNFLLHFSFK